MRFLAAYTHQPWFSFRMVDSCQKWFGVTSILVCHPPEKVVPVFVKAGFRWNGPSSMVLTASEAIGVKS